MRNGLMRGLKRLALLLLVSPPPLAWAASTTTIWTSAERPAPGQSTSDPTSVELGLRWRADVAGQVVGLRFYKRNGSNGTHTGHLWTNTGTLLGSLTFTGETASGWQTASFPAPIAILANTTYVASYHAASGYAVTVNAFATAGVDRAPLHALRSGVDGLNGVYAQSPNAVFPNRSTQASNYWVDVVFAASGSTAPVSNPVPALASLSPSSATAGGAAFTLRAFGSGFVSGATVRWNGADRATVLVSSAQLNASILAADIAAPTTAQVTVFNPAPGGGVSGGLTFTIDPAGTPPPTGSSSTIWTNAQGPAAGEGSSDPTSLELGLRWRTDAAGQITGLRFYKRSGNNGTHTGHLWTNTGALLGYLTFTGETASGWQTASFGSPIAVQANTTYMASYHTASGYSVTTNAFATAGVDRAPLHALKSGVDGLNGTYAVSANAVFPNNSTQASNYWVDVVFVSGSTVPASNPVPSLASLSPSSATAGGAAFTLRAFGSGFVSGATVRWNGADRATVLVSSAQLNASILAGDIAAPTTAQVTVFNPAPGGGLSNAVALVVHALAASTSCLTSAGTWRNRPIAAQADRFEARFEVTAHQSNMDGVAGFSNGAADDFTDLASIVRFNTAGFIDARDAGGYAAVNTVAYSSGVLQRFRLEIRVPERRYYGWVSSGGGGEVLVASNYQFRLEQSSISLLNNLGLFATTGSETVCNVAISTLPNPAPRIFGVLPASAIAGSAGFSLRVEDDGGVSFVPSSKVRWNGADRPTTYITSHELRAAISAADIASPGSASVTVFTPAPGGGISNAATFTILPPGSAEWQPTAVMNVTRSEYALTVLADGRVLALGGTGATFDATRTAELYNPVSGVWTLTGSMSFDRYRPAAVLLSDGRVLVSGGRNTEVEVASAELFNPASGAFTVTGSMASARSGHTLTRLADGRALVTEGASELYNPATGAWTPTGTMTNPRTFHAAALLADGKVLAMGGGTLEIVAAASAERYDPGTGAWSAAGSMSVGRAWHTATRLNNGKVLVTGGLPGFGAGAAFSSAELYDPSSNAWSPTASMSSARARHTATLLADGRVLVSGGITNADTSVTLATAEVYDPGAGTWSAAGNMAIGRHNHQAVPLSSGKVLAAGGRDGSGEYVASAELYTPTASSSCLTSAGAWQNSSFASQTGSFRARFDATPSQANMDGVAGLSNGAASDFPALAANVRFNTLGRIDARNGGFYAAASTIPYVAGTAYHVRLDVSVPSHSYSAFVSTAGAAERLVGSGFAFRTEQGAVGSLNDLGVFADLGSLMVCNLVISTLTAPNPVPSIAALSPQRALPGATGFTMTVSGSGFVSGAAVRWNGSPRATTFVSASTLTASIAAGDVVSIGTFAVTVFNPGPGGGVSNASTFTVSNWVPTGSTAQGSTIGVLLADGRVLAVGMDAENPAPGQLYTRASGTWRATAGLTSPRILHAAVRLPNGKVLLAGGSVAHGCCLNDAELYDPATDAFSATGSMNVPKGGQTAVLLNDGRVLYVASYSTEDPFGGSSAELYNVAGGSWTLTAPMSVSRRRSALTKLSDGRVLVTGGTTAGAEIYNPVSGTWSPAGVMSIERNAHTATLLADGRVLVAGGEGPEVNFVRSILKTAEIYNPATNSWTATVAMNLARVDHRGTLRPDGRVLVSGGNYDDPSLAFKSEFYDPGSGNWGQVEPLNGNLFGHSATVLTTGEVLAASVGNAELYTAVPPNPAPALTSLSPSTAAAGGSAFTLTVTGSGFLSTSTVRWNGAARATTFFSGSKLTAAIPAGDIASPGTAAVMVFNPTPGGGVSNSLTFTINSPASTACLTSAGAWQNASFASQTGSFRVRFDATPGQANMDGAAGLSDGAASAFSGLAANVRFNVQGSIDARNGGFYAAASTIPYSAGTAYHVRLDVNVPTHDYSAFVSSAGAAERLVGSGFAFRTEQNTVSSLNDLGVFADLGSLLVCNLAISTITAPPPPPSGALLTDSFTGPDALITNEYAFYNPNAADAVKSSTWQLTSGSLFRSGNMGWTGVPDNGSPNAGSTNATGSAVFRLTTKRADLGDVSLSASLINRGFTAASTASNGISLILRYQSAQTFYYFQVNRKDNTAVIKKKLNGTYTTLISRPYAFALNTVQLVQAVAKNSGGSVTLQLSVGGVLLASITDAGTGGAAITAAGAAGIWSDNVDFKFDDFTVAPVSAAPLAPAAVAGALAADAPASSVTRVSLTFDDAFNSHLLASRILDERGFKGTFYINTGRLGRGPLYLTLGDVQALQAAGHEVGGHTIDHPDVTKLSPAEQQHQICDDRAALVAAGLEVVSFAYPLGAYDDRSQAVVKGCGYASARSVGGMSCANCARAVSLPPADPYAAPTPASIKSDTTLDTMKKMVTDAEAGGGGWVPIVFHQVCDNCDTLSVSPARLSAFVDWLGQRAERGTVVHTVRQVIDEGARPPPPPSASVAATLGTPRVFPNPWNIRQHAGLPLTFDTLSPETSVKIFTVSGRWVKTLQSVGGRAVWDLRTDSGQSAASGFYLYHATDPQGGKTVGKLAVIK